MTSYRLLLTILFIAFRVEAEQVIPAFNVSIDKMNWNAYQSIDNGRPGIASRINKSLGNDRRVLSDFYIMQRAIAITGDKNDLVFFPGTNSYSAYMQNIRSGESLSNGDTQFVTHESEFKDNFFITQPVLKAGQFHVGLYAYKDNLRALSSGASDLHKLSAISNPEWTFDWQELSSIGLRHLRSSRNWQEIFESVRRMESDFTLQAFSRRNDLSFQYKGEIFLPIKGLKLQFKQSRHYLISKKHPQGKVFYNRLENGLSVMRKTGEIDRIYQETGVFNFRVRDWAVVNP